jgi:hypothetical protein
VSNQANHDGWLAVFSMALRRMLSWWRADRIRVSPTAGELLRLGPFCCLYVNGQYAQVVDREVRDETQTVVYECSTRAEPGTLVVRIDSAKIVTVEWHQGGQVMRLDAADVEVFAK